MDELDKGPSKIINASIKDGENKDKATRKSLSKNEEIALWVASGGQCAVCKKPLLLNGSKTFINLADKAHILAHSTEGPRGERSLAEYSLTEADLYGINNLMLLCKEHHKTIDDEPEAWPPDRLFKIKKDHENDIRAKLDSKKSSLALIHRTLTDLPISENLARNVDTLLLGKLEYVEVHKEFSREGWKSAKAATKNFFNNIKIELALNNYSGLSVFPLSHIPLLVYLGFLITDKVPVTTFQYDRINNQWVGCNPAGTCQVDNLKIKEQVRGKKELVVIISNSAPVKMIDVLEGLDAVNFDNYDAIDISVDNPSIDRVLHSDDVKKIQLEFKSNVERLIYDNRYALIHMFVAVPAGLAVEMGRSINPTMWPRVRLYNYNFRMEPKYQFALEI